VDEMLVELRRSTIDAEIRARRIPAFMNQGAPDTLPVKTLHMVLARAPTTASAKYQDI